MSRLMFLMVFRAADTDSRRCGDLGDHWLSGGGGAGAANVALCRGLRSPLPSTAALGGGDGGADLGCDGGADLRRLARDQFVWRIRYGGNGMPGYGPSLIPEDLNAIVAFLFDTGEDLKSGPAMDR